MTTGCLEQLTLWNLGPQQVTVTFQGGRLVSDAGLLGIRMLDKELGVLSLLGARLPDPRAQKSIVFSRETLLTQQVYQILAGYPDCNDAQTLRKDPLFQTLLDLPADEDAKPLASGSTLARFAQAYTRREAELPLEDRAVLHEVASAQNQRLKILNDYLPELFARTRREPPATIILDLDASDDPAHGQQVLSFYHGYYEQNQYFPLYVFDGATGFPLAAWLRPGTVHASCGAVEILQGIVAKVEINRQGLNRRFVVTNLPEAPQEVYKNFYVKRGNVPEHPIGELKNGLLSDRLSFHHFRANAMKHLEHVMAFALVILHREATAAIPEVAKAEVHTLRTMLWKVAALVKTSVRRVWFHFSETWPHRELFQRVHAALLEFVAHVQRSQAGNLTAPGAASAPLM